MAIGTVDTIDEHGNGTIVPDRRGETIEFTGEIGRPSLQPGDRVSYSVHLTPGGATAVGLHLRPPAR